MKFFNYSWRDIGEKCSSSIYTVDSEISPYNLIREWLFERKTIEEFSENPDCTNNTTAEKSQIRQERLNMFLPHLEKEYPTFLKLAKKQNFISNLLKFEGILSLIMFPFLAYFFTKFFIALAPIICNILSIIMISEDSMIFPMIYFICAILIPFSYFIAWRLAERFIYMLSYPSIILLSNWDFKNNVKGKKERHLRSFFKKTPYSIAFLIGNGFVNRRDFCSPYESKLNWYTLFYFVVPYKEIKNLSFNEFINYIKIRVEPTFKTYHRIERYVDSPKYVETKALHSLFFYLTEEDLQNTSELRSKTLKSASFARDIEIYKEPEDPARDEYGKIIPKRNYDMEKPKSNKTTYDKPQGQYRENTSQRPTGKPKKESSYDRAMSEWKEQLVITALLKNKK